MKSNSKISISLIMDTGHDASMLQDIANIEQQVQPDDNWSEQALKEVLSQDINHCYVILDSELVRHATNKIKPNNDMIKRPTIADHASVESNATVIAYCVFSKIYEVAEILRIGTHPEYQRRGLAKALLEHLLDDLRKKAGKRVLLEVREDNQGAINLYHKLGFETIHIRKAYYQTSDAANVEAVNAEDTNVDAVKTKKVDAFIMQCTLSGS